MKKFKELRQAVGATQTQIAEKLNVAQSTVATWENNESSYPRAELLPHWPICCIAPLTTCLGEERSNTYMAKPFKELRKLMYAEGIDQRSLARQLGKGTTYVSSRIRGLAPWDMLDVYALCESV